LSTVLRYSLDVQKKNLVPLDEELQLLEAYLYLLQIRFAEKIKVKYTAINRAKGFLPPLALQLLLENAVNHNEVSSQNPLLVSIDFDEIQGALSVKNPIQPKRNPTQGVGLGLYNLNQRYLLISDRSIEIRNADRIFEVIIPVLKYENTDS
jgi:two-component system, LytTR family, sensor kinase